MPNWRDVLNALGQPLAPKGAIRGLQESLAPGSSYDGADMEPDADADDNPWLSAGMGMLGIPARTGEAIGAIPDVLRGAVNHPAETAGGFLSGSLEGVRGLTSPAQLAAIAASLGGGYAGAKLLGRFGDEVGQVARPTLDVLEDIPIRQVQPSAHEVEGLVSELGQNLSRIPNATGKLRRPGIAPQAMQGLEQAGPRVPSRMPPEFVPRGGETAWNARRPMGGPSVEMPPPFDPYEAATRRFQRGR